MRRYISSNDRIQEHILRTTIKRIIAISLTLIMLLSLAACGAPEVADTPTGEPLATTKPTNTSDEELDRALALGIVPEELQGEYEAQITFGQYCAMLTNMIAVYNEALLPAWEKAAAQALASGKGMYRDDAMLTLLYAAEILGMDYYNVDWNEDTGENGIQSNGNNWNLSGEYRYFGDPEALRYNQTNVRKYGEYTESDPSTYLDTSMWFSCRRLSLLSGKPLLDWNEKYDLRPQDAFTIEVAIRSVLRLYESEIKIITSTEAKNCDIPGDALAAATGMTDVSDKSIPAWRGTSMDICNVYQKNGRWQIIEEDIAQFADFGFNYLRLMLFWTDFAVELDGTLLFYDYTLQNIDRILEWCVKYDIHLCIDMHELPGYDFAARTAMDNPEERALALLVWEVISSRYASVPSGALSYNLINEPDYNSFTKENYGQFALEMIDIIRACDKTNKLLVSDGAMNGEWGWPCACPTEPNEYLPNDVMQTIHLYPWHAGHRSGYMSLLDWPYEHAQGVNNFVINDGIFKIKGQFPAGAIITMNLNTIHGVDKVGNSIIVEGDGRQIAAYAVDSSTIGEDNGAMIYDNRAEFDIFSTNGYVLEFSLDKAYSEISVDGDFCMDELFIRIPASENHTYAVPDNTLDNGFRYETGSYTTVYIHTVAVCEEKASEITIHDNGSYTVENETVADAFDYETLRTYIKKWAQWSAETGTPIMCNEFGIPVSLPQETRIAYMRSVLDLLAEYDIPWCIYTNQWQCWTPVISDANVTQGSTILPMDDSLTLKDGFWYDDAMLKLFMEYAD